MTFAPAPDFAGWAIALILKSSVLITAAGLVACVLPRAAALRKHLWLLTFLAAAIMPVGELLLPRWSLPLLDVSHAVLAAPVHVGAMEGSSAGLLLLVWMIGSAWSLLRLINDWRAASGLRARAVEMEPWLAGSPIGDLLRYSPVPVQMAWSDELSTAAVIGWRRPTILLPSAARAWTAEMQRAAVLHELEHVRQRDWLILLLERATVALYWFNPLVRAAQGAAAVTREIAADDAVLRARIAPIEYANQLLSLARGPRGERARVLAVGLGGGSVVTRVRALFDEPGHHVSPPARRMLVAAMVSMMLPVVALQPMVCVPTNPVGQLAHLR